MDNIWYISDMLHIGLSDIHKMILTVCKYSFQKSKPKEIVYST